MRWPLTLTIHASDHPEAAKLMYRAYNEANGVTETAWQEELKGFAASREKQSLTAERQNQIPISNGGAGRGC